MRNLVENLSFMAMLCYVLCIIWGVPFRYIICLFFRGGGGRWKIDLFSGCTRPSIKTHITTTSYVSIVHALR